MDRLDDKSDRYQLYCTSWKLQLEFLDGSDVNKCSNFQKQQSGLVKSIGGSEMSTSVLTHSLLSLWKFRLVLLGSLDLVTEGLPSASVVPNGIVGVSDVTRAFTTAVSGMTWWFRLKELQ